MFDRYAVYFTASGELAQLGAAWLGWDISEGSPRSQPQMTEIDLPALSKRPRKYGFHATIKPPFVLANGMTETTLRSAFRETCASLDAVVLQGLEVAVLGRFLALVPLGDASDIKALACRCVASLDAFRAPMSEQELDRRSQGFYSAAQQENLRKWGYPYVMDQFRFHMTLTGRIPKTELALAANAAESYFAPCTNMPLAINSLTLVGQCPDGYFVEIERVPLGTAIQ